MTDWRARLREADPDRRFASRPDEIERVRHVVIAAAGRPSRDGWIAPARAWAFVAATALMAGVGVTASWHAAQQERHATPSVAVTQETGRRSATVDLEGERQQLHFSTPGGTRIIWVFDSQFDSKGTLP